MILLFKYELMKIDKRAFYQMVHPEIVSVRVKHLETVLILQLEEIQIKLPMFQGHWNQHRNYI